MKLKKLLLTMTVPVAAFSLVACSDTGEPTEGTVEKSDLTLEEVYNKAVARQQSLESVTAHIVADQVLDVAVDGETVQMTTTSNLQMDTHMAPPAFLIDGTILMGSNGETMEMPMRMYMTEADGLYMIDGTTDSWMKLPATMTDQMLAELATQGDAAQQLEQLKPYIRDFTFEQSNTDYVLTLEAEGEKFNELILANAGTMLDGLTADEKQLVDSMTFEDAVYVVTVDKETFDTTKVEMDFVLKMDMEGEVAKVDTKSSSTFSNFNEVEPIVVPDEVIDQAEEMTY